MPIEEANEISRNATIRTDVCIIGGGAAGITLAREFIGQDFQVCMLESGGMHLEAETQDLYRGRNQGMPYYKLIESRLRFFGGTTNHWTGWCRPLDELDFAYRSWVPNSGWPFSKSHLDPFYERAQSVCELGPYDYTADTWSELTGYEPLDLDSNQLYTSMFHVSSPTRFGQLYRKEIREGKNLTTLLHANVIDIEVKNKPAFHVTRVKVSTLTGNEFWVSARLFILATGGIENARILLASNKVQKEGLGNQNDLVGRFFMEHLILQNIPVIFPMKHPYSRVELYEARKVGKSRVLGILALSPKIQQDEHLLNCYTSISPVTEGQAEGIESLKALAESLKNGEWPEDFSEHVENVINDVDEIMERAYEIVVKPLRQKRYVLANMGEQAPNPDSRITLGDKRDQLGMRMSILNWRLSEIDRRTIRRVQEIVAQEFGRTGVGRAKVLLNEEDDLAWENNFHTSPEVIPTGGYHHMGTTRMHEDARRGVVDVNCKLHGCTNLFVAGSSVFPTVGSSNPTLTIVALALRLADHVKGIL